MACLSRLAVASVNTHRTRWPTPTPTQTRSYIHLCTQMYNPPHTPSGRSCLSPSAGFNPPRSRQPLGLHGHRTSSLLSRWPGTYLPTPPSLNFAKAARHTRTSNDNIDARKRPAKFGGGTDRSYALLITRVPFARVPRLVDRCSRITCRIFDAFGLPW